MDEADLARLVREQARPGDMVVCLGAGTISAWANALPAKLTAMTAGSPADPSTFPTRNRRPARAPGR
jgi:hypothetical protein